MTVVHLRYVLWALLLSGVLSKKKAAKTEEAKTEEDSKSSSSEGGTVKCQKGMFSDGKKDTTIALCDKHFPKAGGKYNWMVYFYYLEEGDKETKEMKKLMNTLAKDYGNDPAETPKEQKQKQILMRTRMKDLAKKYKFGLSIPQSGESRKVYETRFAGKDPIFKVGAVCCNCRGIRETLCMQRETGLRLVDREGVETAMAEAKGANMTDPGTIVEWSTVQLGLWSEKKHQQEQKVGSVFDDNDEGPEDESRKPKGAFDGISDSLGSILKRTLPGVKTTPVMQEQKMVGLQWDLKKLYEKTEEANDDHDSTGKKKVKKLKKQIADLERRVGKPCYDRPEQEEDNDSETLNKKIADLEAKKEAALSKEDYVAAKSLSGEINNRKGRLGEVLELEEIAAEERRKQEELDRIEQEKKDAEEKKRQDRKKVIALKLEKEVAKKDRDFKRAKELQREIEAIEGKDTESEDDMFGSSKSLHDQMYEDMVDTEKEMELDENESRESIEKRIQQRKEFKSDAVAHQEFRLAGKLKKEIKALEARVASKAEL